MTTTIAAVSDSRIPADTMWVGIPTLLPVRDSAAYAWRNSDQSCLTVLHEHFADDWTEALEPHAIAAMETVLPEVWREHGSVMLPCSEAAMGLWDRDVPDGLFHAVWDEAASRVDPYALVEAAQLTDQYRRYAVRGEQ